MNTFVRYFAVGGVAATVDFLMFSLFIYFINVPWFWAACASFLLATSVSYVLSIRHVFESGVRFSKKHEILLVFLISGVGLAFNQLVLYLGIMLLGMNPLLSKLAATGLVFFWNFFARAQFIFVKNNI